MSIKLLVLLAVGGIAGTFLRYATYVGVGRLHASPMPWATVTVNLAGCFVFGLVWAVAHRRGILADPATVAVLAGFCGAFTTFSTFAFDLAQLLHKGHLAWAVANFVLQNVAGVVMVVAGMAVGRGVAGPVA